MERLETTLPERFDAALRDVHDLASEDGTRALVAEADALGLPLPPEFHALPGPAARGLWFFTRYPKAFECARLVYAADHLAARSCTAVTGLPPALPAHKPEALAPLHQALCEYYRRQARSGRCHIDALVRGNRLLLFEYLDDYPAVHVGFDERDQFRRRHHRPAFEVVFQFTPPTGTLAVFANGGQRVRADLLDLFCQHLLGVPAPAEVLRLPAFRLDHLLHPDATAAVPVAGGVVADLRVRRLRVYLPGTGESVTLETAPHADRLAVYRMLDRHFPAEHFPRDLLRVSWAAVAATFTADDGEERPLTFDLSSRGTTTLTARPDRHQEVGEAVLRAWGVTGEEPPPRTARPAGGRAGGGGRRRPPAVPAGRVGGTRCYGSAGGGGSTARTSGRWPSRTHASAGGRWCRR